MKSNPFIRKKPMAGTVQLLVFLAITQPITATQLSKRLELLVERCSNALARLQSHKLVHCMTPLRTRSRLFWLTRRGKKYQRKLVPNARLAHQLPNIDWQLYASLCFSHRSEIIRTLTRPMQPSEIKRRAAFRTRGLRMSANNVRDVIRYLKATGIVRLVKLKKSKHMGYELTEIGRQMRRLLLLAEVRA